MFGGGGKAFCSLLGKCPRLKWASVREPSPCICRMAVAFNDDMGMKCTPRHEVGGMVLFLRHWTWVVENWFRILILSQAPYVTLSCLISLSHSYPSVKTLGLDCNSSGQGLPQLLLHLCAVPQAVRPGSRLGPLDSAIL